MQILRHSKISLTVEIYTATEQTRAALKRLGNHLRQAGEDSDGASAKPYFAAAPVSKEALSGRGGGL
jgi:GH25 family lysozyme M1 (1,4-beta-N-acetylmuramidase)